MLPENQHHLTPTKRATWPALMVLCHTGLVAGRVVVEETLSMALRLGLKEITVEDFALQTQPRWSASTSKLRSHESGKTLTSWK
jgi:hypothetical protein